MIFRAAISLSFLASQTSVVVAFAPHAPASAVVAPRASARLASESDSSSSSSSSSSCAKVATDEFVDEMMGWPSLEEKVVPSKKPDYEYALLFDCDGVILETEELHRLAYNAAFREFEVTRICGDASEPVEWSVGYYDILQNSIGGGKPKMRHYFSQLLRFESNEKGDPTVVTANVQTKKQKRKARRNKKKKKSSERTVTVCSSDIATGLESLIDALQTRKTELYKTTVEETAVPRPGLLDLMDEALADDSIAVGVCSASTRAAAEKVLECTLGPDRVKQLDVCILGDDVSEKKPSPMIYDTARAGLGIDAPEKCVVVEDSAVGLRAAKSAGMRCVITYTASTTNEDFYGMGADAKVPDLVNNGNPVTLDAIFGPLRTARSASNEDFTVVPELLVGLKDDPVAPDEEDEECYDDDDNLIVSQVDEGTNDDEETACDDAEEEPSSEDAESTPPIAEADTDEPESEGSETDEAAEEPEESSPTEEPFGEYSPSSPSSSIDDDAAVAVQDSIPDEEEEEDASPPPPVTPETPSAPTQPRRRRPRMVQDDMGNFFTI